jgi:hypothetical protein
MNSLLNKSQRFLKKNSATILTCVGAVGVVATTVTAVKSTPKALMLLDTAKKEKGEELTKLETIKIAGPAYIPTVVLGASTLACIFGANILNKRGQAALMSMYALVDSGYKDYRKKVDDIYGKEAGKQVRAGIAKDKYAEKYSENPLVPEDGKRLYYDFFSDQYFEARPFDVQRAEYELNRTLMLDDCVYLDDWYRMIGIDPLEPNNNFGWTTCGNMDAYWQTWIDFHHETVEIDDGLECIVISFMQDPFPDFEDLY